MLDRVLWLCRLASLGRRRRGGSALASPDHARANPRRVAKQGWSASLALTLLLCMAMQARAQPMTVFAAASLTDAMHDVDALWRNAGHAPLRMNLAASSTLARQMEQGAVANIFASADERWMNYAQDRDLIVTGTRRVLLGNSLVLVMAREHARTLTIDATLDFQALLGPTGRIATGDPSSVPAGLYARQAFERLGLWDQVRLRLAPAESVRAALLLVERGEAPAGIVYATDAAVSPGLAIAGTFPPTSHDPIVYPFAVGKAGDTPEAHVLLDFLSAPEARSAFYARGFTPGPQ